MPAEPFSVHPNLDEIAERDIAAALRPAVPGGTADHPSDQAAHHGAGDSRQASRERSGRARAGRAGQASGGRSYAFRRS
ncbi:hypothetical protein GCM10010112_29990 [Actinoplanes lobatus]|uniref:Uncharacterized protein n=1 Tax=Actinoplanes lobatus TaxID=113568 RepID=A0A7W7HQH5_9ACTN|nr:hypothetical protein [Actinoplanes lobatus]MBB4754709.1 hypothetical protein [Actinoplanes lobatus]GGN66993.1 hypothetical protein GCM10010112_29990 [Actinoplanes lobatus]GIE42439.1 hypothetical protein Alo02nite_53370 [Actinoplanes lobatus]